MPQKPYDKNKLLEMNDTLDILTVFLLKGIKKGITFSEFQHILGSKDQYLKSLFKDRKKINKDVLKNRLKQMVREGLLIQRMPKGPYCLKEKWFNLPIKIILRNIIDYTNINDIFLPMDNVGNNRVPRFNDIDVICGLNFDNLSEKNRHELKKKMNELKLMTLDLFNLKRDIIDEKANSFLDSFYDSLNDSEKTVWSSIRKKNPSFYSDLINLSHSLIIIVGGKAPTKSTNEIFFSYNPESIRSLKIRALELLNKKLVEYYPFGVGLFSFYDIMELDRGILSENQRKQLLIARSKNRKITEVTPFTQ